MCRKAFMGDYIVRSDQPVRNPLIIGPASGQPAVRHYFPPADIQNSAAPKNLAPWLLMFKLITDEIARR